MVTIYGIANCDTMKKARKWLDERGVAYSFHDYREQNVDETLLRDWVRELGWDTLINRRGTTWRRLPEEVREGLGQETAIRLMLKNPSIIRRPVLDTGKARLVGFSAEAYEEIFR